VSADTLARCGYNGTVPEPTVAEKLTHYFSRTQLLKYPKGHVILPAFSETPGVYFVSSGLVKQYTLTASGQELVVNIYKPGSFFPMISVMTGGVNNYFFESLEKSEVYRAPVTETLDFLESHPDVLMDLTKRLYIGLDGLLQQVTYNAIGSTYQSDRRTLDGRQTVW
jgi:CRP-like cAMP-binding protein